MTKKKCKEWSEEYNRYIYKDESGNWMIDEFGPTDEFSLPRQLRRQQNDLRSERSTLKPKGPIPTNDEERLMSVNDDDVDALQVAHINEQIENLEWQIQEEMEREQRSREFSKRGRIGAQESNAVRQEKVRKRHDDWRDLAEKKHERKPDLRPWGIARIISNIYIEQGSSKSYSQRAIFDVIKVLDCFKTKNS